MAKKTVVLGASENPGRYSYLAIHALKANGHPVVAIGKRPGNAAGISIQNSIQNEKEVDTVTLYLNPTHQKAYYDYILSLHPKRVIFNPGAENEVLADLCRKNGIEPVEACTLVLLKTGQY